MNTQQKAAGNANFQAATQKYSQANYTTAPIDLLLSRLERVKQTAPDKWVACCPSHPDKTPSLGIREAENGLLLIKCRTGCGTEEVVRAVGLEMSDLFPRNLDGRTWDASAPRAKVPKFRAAELLELAALESRIVAMSALQIAQGFALSADDLIRVSVAAEVLYKLWREAV